MVNLSRRHAALAAAAAVAASAVVLGVVLSNDDDGRTVEAAVRVTTTTTWIEGPPRISAARVQGAVVTVIAWIPDTMVRPASYEPAFHLCEDLHPSVAESADQVVVELVATAEPGVDWATCHNGRFSTWGTLALSDPLGDRPLVDSATGAAVPVIDGAQLLFPSALPAPFDVAHWGERAGDDGLSWSFEWLVGPRDLPGGALGGPVLGLTITRWDGASAPPMECTARALQVRGVTGNLCDTDAGSRLLSWTEGGGSFVIELMELAGDPLPEDIDVVAIAERLQPLAR